MTCAAVLAQEGLGIGVFEQRRAPGGAAATEELVPGYRFSTCAYAVHLLHEAVVERLGLEVEMLSLPPRVGVLPDGAVVRDGDLEPAAFKRWESLWEGAARAVDSHLLGPPPRVDDLGLGHLAGLSNSLLLSTCFASAEARALYSPRYCDCPSDAPGGPLACAYVETGRRRDRALKGLPRGGMGALAEEFALAAERAGADPVRTYRLAGRELEDVELRPAGAKLHLALRGRPELPGEGGLVHIYPRVDWYERAWPDRAEDSLVELQLPTVLDPSLAPAGGHSLSAYVPLAPRGRRDELERLLLGRVAAVAPNLGDLLVDRVLHAPEDLERRLGLTGAQIHHLAHVPGQMFAARGDGTTDVEGLFLCGAGIHPGGEVSGVPGLNAARTVLESLS